MSTMDVTRSMMGFLSVAAVLAAGCVAEPGDGEDGEVGAGSEAEVTEEAQGAVQGCGLPGTAIDAKGSFSCDFGLPGAVPLGEVPAIIERDRMYMAEQPGMITKQLPIALDFATGNLFSGGRYLFDTAKHAADYEEWVREDFVLDGVPFLDRPIFLQPDCHSWKVIGARAFAPIESQVVVRTERWSVPGHKVKKVLEKRWGDVVQGAADAGMTAVWLLHAPEEDLVQLVYFTDSVGPVDPTQPDFPSLFALQDGPALGDGFAKSTWTKTFDRTEWILTVWFPFEAGDQGAASLWPYSPPFPQPFCGDGVCEPSRGEGGASCASDCPAGCGDAVCQAGETTANCPGDCRI